MYTLNNRGVELSKEGRLDEALTVFTEGIEQDSSDSALYYNRALVYMKLKKFEKAVEDLEKSVSISANDDNLRELGTCYIYMENFKNAKTALSKAVSDYNSSQSENVMGVLCFKLGNYKRAAEHFRKALELDSSNSEARLNLKDTEDELKI